MEDRWIFNKLALAERLGYKCGPTGMQAPRGTYCVRPTYNLYGNGEGGFYKIEHDGNRNIPNRPGYFWCEWFEGEHTWAEYINDRFSAGMGGVIDEATGSMPIYEIDAVPMEPEFRGISRYMTIERIGGKMIEASTRLMAVAARHKVVRNYRKIDPTYDPDDVEYGMHDHGLRVVNAAGGYEWYDHDGPRAPWGED